MMGRIGKRATGTATFVFTDVEGSTRLLKQLRDRYGEVLAEHQRLVRQAFAAHDGSEIDTQGDSFFAVFPSARGAVLAAIDAQRALDDQAWPEGAQVRIRVGIHTGEAVREGKRYVGLSVHRAARICAAAHGGQILVSQTTVNVLDDEEDELRGFALRDLGSRQLKDLDRPARLFQVEAAGLGTQFPPIADETAVEREPLAGPKDDAATREVDAAGGRRARVPSGPVRVVAALLGAAALAALLVTAVAAVRDSDPTLAPPRSLAYIDPATNELEGFVELTASPTAVVFADGAIWVALRGEQNLLRIDPQSKEVVRIGLGITPDALAADEDVWVGAIGGRRLTVVRVVPHLNDVVDRYTLPSFAFARFGQIALAVSEPLVWIGHNETSDLYRIETDTRRVRKLRGFRVEALAARPDVVWAVERYDEAITRLDPSTGRATAIPFGAPRPATPATEALRSDAEADEEGVWVSDALDGKVWRVRALTNSISGSTSVGLGARELAVGAGGVWVANPLDGAVVRLDSEDGAVDGTVRVGATVAGVAVGAGRIWVAVP